MRCVPPGEQKICHLIRPPYDGTIGVSSGTLMNLRISVNISTRVTIKIVVLRDLGTNDGTFVFSTPKGGFTHILRAGLPA